MRVPGAAKPVVVNDGQMESQEHAVPGSVDAVLPGRIGMLVRLNGRPGTRPALLDVLNRYTDRLNAEEPGTEMFMVCVDPDDADLVWLHEWFTDEAAQRAHQASAAFIDMMNEMPELLAKSPGVLRLDPLRLHLSNAVVNASF